jgi:predicted GIY-YIG superfamily endonuclease
MPKTPTDFSRCIIYKIVCFDTNITDCYVGHTTDFIRRKSQHKSRYNNPNNKEYNKKVYQFIRSHGDWDQFSNASN